MASLPERPTKPVALYCRVSTDEQAERQTVQAQLDFLRRYAELFSLPIAAEYVDDGFSGTLSLSDRPYGRQLLADAEAGRFGLVVCYKVDRLARSLSVLMEAYNALQRCDVGIRSAQESFDTASPSGRFFFQLLGSMAEFDRATILERMTMGRDRVARAGKWFGAVPYGYQLNADGQLVPDEARAAIVRGLYERIAAGSTTIAEAQRMNALGVPCGHRYAGGRVDETPKEWRCGTVYKIIINPVYRGHSVLKSKLGEVTREVPALVSPELWDAAQQQLKRNRWLSTKNAKRRYLLRGLVTCARCGANYVGAPGETSAAWSYYRCSNTFASHQLDGSKRCRGAANLRSDWIEPLVWADCREYIENPGPYLAQAQAELRARLGQASDSEAQRRALLQQVAAKEQERDRVLTLYRRGRITIEEAERQMDATAREVGELRQMADALQAQGALTQEFESQVTEAAAMLIRLRGNLDEIERADDWDRKREIVELLVAGLTVHTEGEGRGRQAHVHIRYRFGSPRSLVVANPNAPAWDSYHSTLTIERVVACAR